MLSLLLKRFSEGPEGPRSNLTPIPLQHTARVFVLGLAAQVGAINTRLVDVPWLDVRAIDLKSQHPRIEECDFFSLQPSGEYDVISSR